VPERNPHGKAINDERAVWGRQNRYCRLYAKLPGRRYTFLARFPCTTTPDIRFSTLTVCIVYRVARLAFSRPVRQDFIPPSFSHRRAFPFDRLNYTVYLCCCRTIYDFPQRVYTSRNPEAFVKPAAIFRIQSFFSNSLKSGSTLRKRFFGRTIVVEPMVYTKTFTKQYRCTDVFRSSCFL